MNQNTPTDDQLDGLLSDFFKSEMKQPWPAAPATAPLSAPAARQQPTARDESRASRYTLAASVALLLGTCWALSNGFQPADRAATGAGGPNVLNPASAGDPAALKELRKDHATKGKTDVAPPKAETKIELP
jgi:hypothetical protein